MEGPGKDGHAQDMSGDTVHAPHFFLLAGATKKARRLDLLKKKACNVLYCTLRTRWRDRPTTDCYISVLLPDEYPRSGSIQNIAASIID